MQLMCDAVTVLGSRHGLLMNPMRRECGIIRFGAFDELPRVCIRAGIRLRGKDYVLPLSPQGESFAFHDQRLTPCTMSVMGIDPLSRVKLKLTVVTPFRPRDAEFSTTPVLGLRLEASLIPGQFRWRAADKRLLKEAEIFVAFHGTGITTCAGGRDALDLGFKSAVKLSPADPRWKRGKDTITRKHVDRLVALNGSRRGQRFVRKVKLAAGQPVGLDLAWCSHEEPVLLVNGEPSPFRYAGRFANLAAVADWARRNPTALFDNASLVDGIVGGHNGSVSASKLLAYTLHSWLACSWWTRQGARDWFSIWEGSCYFHSTVDVEYTQAPFYLAVWPELLGIELHNWTDFSKDGTQTLGERGRGTLFLSHDMGQRVAIGSQVYAHDMEVEETVNFLILAYAHWRRTGDRSVLVNHTDTLVRYLAFLAACDTTGDGVPDQGVANTIDDASPAVQFGKKQVYLAVKTLAAFRCGVAMLEAVGQGAQTADYAARAERIRAAVETKGWLGDHYATLLDKVGKGMVDPWSGKRVDVAAIPGWDAAHIYTANGLALLDMVGCDVGLDVERLRTDLQVATAACLREYGCIHTAAANTMLATRGVAGLVGVARNPGWVAMNLLRDVAAFYRGVDLRALVDRYWDWQVTTNTQEPCLFFETFNGNNLCFYPRGLAIWGFFDALGGLVIDRVAGRDTTNPAFPGVRVPRLFDADWATGRCGVIRRD